MSSTPFYDHIYQTLLEKITTKKLTSGDRIPSEKELAEQFNVSRITSKHALDKLAQEKWIERRVGIGSFVADPLPTMLTEKSENLVSSVGNINNLNPGQQSINSPLIGVVLQDWSPSYGTLLLSGIEQSCTENNYGMLLRRSYGNQSQEEKAIEYLISQGVKGLIIYPVNGEHYSPLILRLHLDGFPIVLVDRYLPGIPTAAVYSDNRNGAIQATEYLIKLGHKHIALLSPDASGTISVQDRIDGFSQALIDNGISVDQSTWLTDLPTDNPTKDASDELFATIKDLLQHETQLTAVFAAEYRLALKTKQIAQKLGIRVPEDLSIVCFDHPLLDEEDHVFFTHIQQAEYEMGYQSVALLSEHFINGKNSQAIILPAQLIVAASTAKVKRSS